MAMVVITAPDSGTGIRGIDIIWILSVSFACATAKVLIHSSFSFFHHLSTNNPEKKLSTSVSENDQYNILHNILSDYFQLSINLDKLYNQWTTVDENFGKVAKHFPGVRILRQDPTENLVSFICSSNNNIARITSMVEKLCQKYGSKLLEVNGRMFYNFPSLEALAGETVEQELRKLGFGYRAKYISETAKHITLNLSPEWLESLRKVPYEEARTALMQLPGVGAKVADCVCLMSLDKPGAIPIDTHVWQITVRDYLHHLKATKSLTDKVYSQVGNFFRERFGEYAGWAHSVLFSADLKKFKEKKTSK
ncbi:N-glycosylase/DNA lyase-like [Limulus polyphemus]|uniref:DNA-(apurinic or apyrimidinic site) lyase n=1 Tax=Limulus polyphemus TaxID=6850 RepID=A0ABM1B4Z5_LIMPO|nr:N-glycosylase/DNA lyase-like [Limulus polyphemus]